MPTPLSRASHYGSRLKTDLHTCEAGQKPLSLSSQSSNRFSKGSFSTKMRLRSSRDPGAPKVTPDGLDASCPPTSCIVLVSSTPCPTPSNPDNATVVVKTDHADKTFMCLTPFHQQHHR